MLSECGDMQKECQVKIRQGMEGCIDKPRHLQDFWQLPEARKRQGKEASPSFKAFKIINFIKVFFFFFLS